MRAIQSVLELPIPEPDELSWRRTEAKLDRSLEAPGQVLEMSMDLPPGATADIRRAGSTTVDLVRGRRWLVAGLAAAAVVAGFIAVAPRGSRSTGAEVAATRVEAIAPLQKLSPANAPAVIESGAAPLRVELATGQVLGLSSRTELTVPPEAAVPELRLDAGRVDVWTPPSAPKRRVFLVRTPERTLSALSRDFTVAYQAGRIEVEVREGAVRTDDREVLAGERWVSEPEPVSAAEPRLAVFDRLRARGVAARRRAEDARRIARSSSAPSDVAPIPTTPQVPPEDALAASQEGQTRVEALGPVGRSAAEQTWAKARSAWYEARDATAAVRWARAVLTQRGRTPGLDKQVYELLCDAQVSLRSGEAALSDCRELLDREREPRRIRRIHYTLASVHRHHLGDCSSALEHYDRALVFGGTTRFDDVVRLNRAECALEVGDAHKARADLDALSGREATGERVTRAQRRLEDLAKEARSGPDDAE